MKNFCLLLAGWLTCLALSPLAGELASKAIDLGLQESDQSEALAVNDKEEIIGKYWMGGEQYHVLRNQKGDLTVIDLPETATIVALNNQGQLAGNYLDSKNRVRGFVWNIDEGFIDIGNLGGSFAYVHAMNDWGQVVGESETNQLSPVDKQPEVHAFLWQAGAMTQLGPLVGDLGLSGDKSIATGINVSVKYSQVERVI